MLFLDINYSMDWLQLMWFYW